MTKQVCRSKSSIILRRVLPIAAVLLLFALVFVAPAAAEEVQVADVSGTKYTSLQAAINAAGTGATVTMLENVELTEMVTIANTKHIILDLNGKAITVTKSGDRSLYAFENRGTLMLIDSAGTGSITARGNYNYGTMVMNGGTIIACDTNGGYGVWNYGDFTMNGGAIKVTHVGTSDDASGPTGLGTMANAKTLITGGTFEGKSARTYIIASEGEMTITPAEGKDVSVTAPRAVAVDAGTTTINGGTFTTYDSRFVDGAYAAYETYYSVYADHDDATVIINGGTFNAPEYAVKIGGGSTEKGTSTITIAGGSFKAPLSEKYVCNENEQEGKTIPEDVISVSGGVFTTKPASKFLADNCKTVKTVDETWVVGSSIPELTPQEKPYTGEVTSYVLPEALKGHVIIYSQEDNVVDPINIGTYNVTVYHIATKIGDTYYANELTNGLRITRADQILSFEHSELRKSEADADFINPITYAGDEPISYSSSDESVATVDSEGKVTIIAAGTTTITATVGATAHYNAATATYQLTVLNIYTITWKLADGTTKETKVVHGEIPIYEGSIPIKANSADGKYTYTFNGWSPALYPADKVQLYTAQFTEIEIQRPSNDTPKGSSVWLTESQTPTQTPTEQPTIKPTDTAPTDIPTTQPTPKPEKQCFGILALLVILAVIAGLGAVAVLRRK